MIARGCVNEVSFCIYVSFISNWGWFVCVGRMGESDRFMESDEECVCDVYLWVNGLSVWVNEIDWVRTSPRLGESTSNPKRGPLCFSGFSGKLVYLKSKISKVGVSKIKYFYWIIIYKGKFLLGLFWRSPGAVGTEIKAPR